MGAVSEAPDVKWWHVADKEVEDMVSKLGGDDPFRAQPAATIVTAPARPPRPRWSGFNVATRGARPHVSPGTPLMSYRSHSTPCSSKPVADLSVLAGAPR